MHDRDGHDRDDDDDAIDQAADAAAAVEDDEDDESDEAPARRTSGDPYDGQKTLTGLVGVLAQSKSVQQARAIMDAAAAGDEVDPRHVTWAQGQLENVRRMREDAAEFEATIRAETSPTIRRRARKLLFQGEVKTARAAIRLARAERAEQGREEDEPSPRRSSAPARPRGAGSGPGREMTLEQYTAKRERLRSQGRHDELADLVDAHNKGRIKVRRR